jgi:hypothetical protein
MRIGFAGLGRWACPQPRRQGFDLVVWNRTHSVAEHLAAGSDVQLPNPRVALRNIDIVVTILADDAASGPCILTRLFLAPSTTHFHRNGNVEIPVHIRDLVGETYRELTLQYTGCHAKPPRMPAFDHGGVTRVTPKPRRCCHVFVALSRQVITLETARVLGGETGRQLTNDPRHQQTLAKATGPGNEAAPLTSSTSSCTRRC